MPHHAVPCRITDRPEVRTTVLPPGKPGIIPGLAFLALTRIAPPGQTVHRHASPCLTKKGPCPTPPNCA